MRAYFQVRAPERSIGGCKQPSFHIQELGNQEEKTGCREEETGCQEEKTRCYEERLYVGATVDLDQSYKEGR